jgi:tetratricopeptide (TPR) repeat protein
MRRYWFLLPFLLAVIVRAPMIAPAFVYDDVPLVEEHEHLDEPAFAGEVFKRDYGLEFTGKPVGYYRPLLMLINVGLHRIAGRSPVAYHSFSLIVFGVTLFLLMTAARRLFRPHGNSVALAAGCLYAVHPARTEMIGQFASLPDLLIELMATGLLILLVTEHRDRILRRTASHVAAIGIGLCAGLTKESSFFIIPAMAATVLFSMPRRTERPAWLCATGAIAGLGGAMLLRWHSGVAAQHHPVSYLKALLSDRAGTAVAGLWRAVQDLTIPRPVQVLYLVEGGDSFIWVILLLLAASILLATWALCLRNGKLTGALLIAWFGASSLNLAMVVASRVAYSERYLSVVPAVLAIAIVSTTLRRWVFAPSSKLPAAVGVAYIIALSIFSIQGGLAFRSEEGFFQHMATYASPRDPCVAIALATVAAKRGDLNAMERHIAEAAARSPNHADVQDIRAVFARRLLDANQPLEALRVAEKVLATAPNHVDSIALKAVALAQLGRLEDGRKAILDAVHMDPTNKAFRVLLSEIERDISR